MKKLLIVMFLFLRMAVAQFQPSQLTPFQPYQPQPPAIAGFRIQIAKGSINIGSSTVVVASNTVYVTANSTTYIYLNTATGVIQSNTSGFAPTGVYPIAVASTNSSFVVTLTDARPNVFNNGTGGGGGGAGVTITVVSALGAVPSLTNGTLATVTDGTTATDCTVGGGSTLVNCQYNGSTWSGIKTGLTTGVTTGASSGLQGGASSGAVALSLLTSCLSGQSLQWNGSAWVCATVSGAPAAGVNTFQYNNAGAFGASGCTWTSGTNLQTCPNQSITGQQTIAGPYQMQTIIPVPACTVATFNPPLTAGFTGFCINSTGYLAEAVNGAPPIDIPLTAGNSVTLTPSVTQSVIQPTGTTLNDNIFNNVRYVTPSFNWTQTLATNWATPGAQTATLTPCPQGVDASNNKQYMIYIPTTNTEATLVTGGTCTSGAASGTVTFTTLVAHSASSNVIQSASSGIQEAINDACGIAATGNPNCKVITLPTGANANATNIYGTVFQHCSRCVVDAQGTLFYTSTRDRAWMMGDQVSANDYSNTILRGAKFSSTITVDGCTITNTAQSAGTPGTRTITTTGCSTLKTGDTWNINFTDDARYWGSCGPITVSGQTITCQPPGTLLSIASAATPGTITIQNAAVEDNAFPGSLETFEIASVGGGLYNQGVVADDDELATYSKLNYQGGIYCKASHCGSVLYAYKGAPVITVRDSNISPQCQGNGITVYNNNTVKVSDTVIQGFGMWGVNTQTLLGSFGGTTLDNVYNEEGAGPCASPYNPGGTVFSAAGIIWEGNVQALITNGGEQPGGRLTVLTPQNAGTTQYNYYVIGHDTTQAVYTAPLLAGFASTNGTGTVGIQFPRIPPQTAGDTVLYDILRLSPPATGVYTSASFPVRGACTGGSATACGSVLTGQTQCAGLVCTFTDASVSANTTSYTINSPSWYPILPFWPGNVVFPGNGQQTFVQTQAVMDRDASAIISVNQGQFINVIARICNNSSTNLLGGATESCQDDNLNQQTTVGTLINDGLFAANNAGVKGKLNFQGINIRGHHIITLVDSNTSKTQATQLFRPQADANDTWIGSDNVSTGVSNSSAQLAFGAPVAISNYIANVGDGTSALEKLTATLKSFIVPITTTKQVTSTLANGTAPFVITSQTRVSNLETGGNPLIVSCGTTTVCSASVQQNGFVVRGTVALTAGTATITALPFASSTWTCTTSDNTTAGNGSNMVEATSTTGTVTGTGTDTISFSCYGN
jgi:hypothetical protein